MTFPQSVRDVYRVVETRYGNGEYEETIPLGSWRKGRGLAGRRGHVYIKGPKEAGVWLIHKQWPTVFADIQVSCPTAKLLQCGSGEMTFSVSWDDLDALLPFLGAKRLRAMTESQKAALAKARESSPIMKRT